MDHKLSLGLAMLPLVPAVQAQEQGRQDGERPNIIFIMSDDLSLIHISEPTRQAEISYAVFCLKKKKKKKKTE